MGMIILFNKVVIFKGHEYLKVNTTFLGGFKVGYWNSHFPPSIPDKFYKVKICCTNYYFSYWFRR